MDTKFLIANKNTFNRTYIHWHLEVNMDLSCTDLGNEYDYATGVCFDSDNSNEFTNDSSLSDENKSNTSFPNCSPCKKSCNQLNVQLCDKEHINSVSEINEHITQYSVNNLESEDNTENNG